MFIHIRTLDLKQQCLLNKPGKCSNLTYDNSDNDRLKVFVHFVSEVKNNLYKVHCIAIYK